MFNNNGVYRIEAEKRVYLSEVSMSDIFVSEMLIHINNHINLGYKIYYLNCKSKHNFSLNKEELKYLYKENSRVDETLSYFFSENIKFIKCFQKQDLFFLTNLENLGLLVLLPKMSADNKYYFDLILGFKNQFDIGKFNKNKFQSVVIDSYVELNKFNLCCDYINFFFNIENNKFKNFNINTKESELWVNEFINIGDENSKLSIKGRRFFKKIVFKLICFHLYWLEGEHQLSDSLFQIDHGYKERILIPTENNKFQIIESYEHCSLEDLIGYNREYFCFNFWRIYEHL